MNADAYQFGLSGVAPLEKPLLRIDRLRVEFGDPRGRRFFARPRVFRALDGVDLTLGRGETLGLIGESGSGKTTLGKAIVGLVPASAGSILVDGTETAGLPARQRGAITRSVQMIFQDPYASLHPRQTIAKTLLEPLRIHKMIDRGNAASRVSALLELVGLSPDHANRYPQHFSGGQRQRIAIARALANDPELVIADEPVSALDVSVQAQILNLMQELQQKRRLAMLFISHDLSVVRHLCQRTAVMYLGRIVETGPTEQLITNPAHPYTAALISAAPRVQISRGGRSRPIVLSGDVPSHASVPDGCPFHTRCWLYEKRGRPARCRQENPVLRNHARGRQSACFFPTEVSKPPSIS